MTKAVRYVRIYCSTYCLKTLLFHEVFFTKKSKKISKTYEKNLMAAA